LPTECSGDYDDFVQYDGEMIATLRPQAEAFIAALEEEMGKVEKE
jgi:hypothetical protein